jgi:hypothetical protein
LPVFYRIDPTERIVYLTIEGDVVYVEFLEALLAAIADPAFCSGFNFLSDRRSQTNAPTNGTAQTLAQFFRANANSFGHCRWAALSPRMAINRVQRMLSVYAESSTVKVEVFQDFAEARRWLLSV